VSVAGLEKAGILVFLMLASPAVARWRVARRERAEADRPLYDIVLLEIALAPRDPDDSATLEVLRGLLRQHNHVREANVIAPEIVRLHSALTALQRATLRAALLRLRECGDTRLEKLSTEALHGITQGVS
jgi:hypothetical protein